MELDRPAPGPNVRDAGAGPPVLARDEPAADKHRETASAALLQVFREGAQGDPCDPLLNQTAIHADDHALRKDSAKELRASKAETPGEAVPVKKRGAFGEITNTDGQPAEPQPKRPARKRQPSQKQKDANEAAAKEAAPPKEEETKRPREPAAAPQKPAAKSKAAPKPPAKKQRAKPPARKKTVAKLSSKAEATSTEGAPQMKKQKAQNYFNAMNREAATTGVAADPETAKLRGGDLEKVRDSALTRGAFGSRELCVSRVASGSAHVDRADGVVGGSRSFRRPRRPSRRSSRRCGPHLMTPRSRSGRKTRP